MPQPGFPLGEVNKLNTRNTRDANDFVHAKRLARKKPLLAGYQRLLNRPKVTAVLVSQPHVGLSQEFQ